MFINLFAHSFFILIFLFNLFILVSLCTGFFRTTSRNIAHDFSTLPPLSFPLTRTISCLPFNNSVYYGIHNDKHTGVCVNIGEAMGWIQAYGREFGSLSLKLISSV